VFVKDKTGLIVIRFFFGVAEAGKNIIRLKFQTLFKFDIGFAPGAIYYLSIWFTKREQAVRVGIFMSSTAVCGVIGGSLAFGILQMDGVLGLKGWQWLFLLEGFPTVIMGVVVWFVLPNHPSDCKWLDEKEKMMATRRLDGGEKEQHVIRLRDIVATFKDPRVLGCAFVYFTIINAFYTVAFFLPALLANFGFTSLQSNLMSTPAYFCAAVVMMATAYHSDKTQERVWHVVVTGFAGVASWALLACACAVRNLAFELVACFCVTSTAWATLAPLLAWLMGSLRGTTSSAVGAAVVIATGNVGGIVGPYILGTSKDGTGNYAYGIAVIAALLGIGMAVLLVIHRFTKPQTIDISTLQMIELSSTDSG